LAHAPTNAVMPPESSPSDRQVVLEMSKQLIAVAIGTAVVLLIACQSLGLFGGTTPTLISPAAFPLILPVAMGLPHWLVVMLWCGLFVGWNPALLKGQPDVPTRTVALWLATACLSAGYFLVSWRTGLIFAGSTFTFGSFILNLALYGVCSRLLWLARTAPSFERSLALQVSLFVWVLTYAFPYFGEAP
jgi:hypothetical protein